MLLTDGKGINNRFNSHANEHYKLRKEEAQQKENFSVINVKVYLAGKKNRKIS